MAGLRNPQMMSTELGDFSQNNLGLLLIEKIASVISKEQQRWRDGATEKSPDEKH